MQGTIGTREAVSITIAAVFLAIYVFFGQPSLIVENKVAGMFLHHFFHLNIIHLIVNIYVLLVLMRARVRMKWIIAAYIIASLSFLVGARPSIGVSNFIYAYIGLCAPPIYHGWWRKPSTIMFIFFTVTYLFVPEISALTHIVSFVGGLATNWTARLMTNMNSDYGKTKRK